MKIRIRNYADSANEVHKFETLKDFLDYLNQTDEFCDYSEVEE